MSAKFDKDTKVIIFHHLPKTGGMNIQRYIQEKLTNCTIKFSDDHVQNYTMNTADGSFFNWGNHRTIKNNIKVFKRNGYPDISIYTIIRDPIDRFISGCNFCLGGGMTKQDYYFGSMIRGCSANDNLDINDFINNQNIFNSVTEYVVFKPYVELMFPLEEYHYIGDYRDYRQSYGTLLTTLGIYSEDPFETYKNKSKHLITKSELNKQSMNILREFYARDIKLYGNLFKKNKRIFTNVRKK